jgi:RHS repeat-associated protein
VDSAGTVGSDDTLCPDLDGSQTNPPPFQGCEPDCTYGADPAILPASTPGCEAEGTCWQGDNMRFEVCRPLKCRVENVTPPPREAPAGGAGWRVARWHGDERGAREPAQVAEAPLPAPSLPWVAGAPGTANGAPAAPAGSLTATAPSASGSSIPFGDRLAELSLGLSAGRLSTPGPSPTRTEFVASGSDPGAGWELPDPPDTAPAARTNAGGISLPPLLIAGGSAKTFRWEFFAWDHLGSVRVVTDAAGTKVWETKYLPFGEEIGPPAASGNTHRFTSHERDAESALDAMGARYYAYAGARFLSVDRAGANPRNAQSWNKYGYVLNRPTTFLDPSGEMAIFFSGAFSGKGSGMYGAYSGFTAHKGVEGRFIRGFWQFIPGVVSHKASRGVDLAKDNKTGVLSILGYSRGGIAARNAARDYGGRVDLLLMADPELRSNLKVSSNVKMAIHVSNGDAMASAADPTKTTVINLNVPAGTKHTAVDDLAKDLARDLALAAEQGKLSTSTVRAKAEEYGLTVESVSEATGGGEAEEEGNREAIAFSSLDPGSAAGQFQGTGMSVRMDGGDVTDPVCGGGGGGRANCPIYDTGGRRGGDW